MAPSKQVRAEQTKQQILQSAEKLFAEKGYDAVSIREIAKLAGCSHTAIYMYFKDKETLLYELSLPALLDLQQRMERMAAGTGKAAERLKEMGRGYIRFCLENRNAYDIFMNAGSSRVDLAPQNEINELRIRIFDLLKAEVQRDLKLEDTEEALAFARIFYYSINGILHTYSYEHETPAVLMARLEATFDLAMDVLLLGFKERIKEAGAHEGQ